MTKTADSSIAAAALAKMAGGVVEKTDLQGLTAYGRQWAAGRDLPWGGAGLNEPLSPYEQCLWAFRCISEIARTVKGIPLAFAKSAPDPQARAKAFRKGRRTGTGHRQIRGCKSVCVGKAAEGELVESGPAVAFFDRPNGYQDWPAFFESSASWLLCEGRVAWVLSGVTGAAARPVEMHVVRGSRIEPVMDQDQGGMPFLRGYWYTAPTTARRIFLLPVEVKYFHLWAAKDDPLAGMGPNVPARLALATDYNASLFNASMLNNGAVAGLTVTYPGSLTPEQREEALASVNARHAGAGSAGKTLFLEDGATAADLGQNMHDMQWDQGKRITRLEICAAYGVPPVVAGYLEAAGDSSAYSQNARQQFYEQTVFPFLDGFYMAVADIASRLDPTADPYFDVEDQPIVQAMRMARIPSAQQLHTMGRPFEDINALLDLGLPQRPGDDVGFLPSGLTPVKDILSGANIPNFPEGFSNLPGAPPPDGGPPEDGADDDETPAGDEDAPATPEAAPGEEDEDDGGQGAGKHRGRKGPLRANSSGSISRYGNEKGLDQVWSAWVRSWEPLAKEVSGMVRARLVVQERKVLSALKRADAKSVAAVTVEKAPPNVGSILVEIFRDKSDLAAWRAKVLAFVKNSQELGFRQALKEAGLSGEELESALKRLLSNPKILRAAASRALAISTRIDDGTRELLRRNLAAGIDAGEDARHLADRVQDVMGNRRDAALGIARNHVGQVLSQARHEGQVDSGMTHKKWIHSRGPGARRPAHVEAERRYTSDPCPIDKPFVINGVPMMYPRDSAAPYEETANCQCVQVAVKVRPAKSATQADWSAAARAVAGTVTWADVQAGRKDAGQAEGEENEHGE